MSIGRPTAFLQALRALVRREVAAQLGVELAAPVRRRRRRRVEPRA